MEISRVRFTDPVARRLIAAALADLAERYGGHGDATPVDGAQFEPPDGAFLVATVDGEPAGCAGWRTRDEEPGLAELKRMHTVPPYRGRGVATALLAAVEESARAAGRKRIWLETGLGQPEAIALYRKLGYALIPNYGYYADHEGCRSFGREL